MDPVKLLRMRGYWEEADEDGGKGDGGEDPVDRGDDLKEGEGEEADAGADKVTEPEGDEGGDGGEKTSAESKTSEAAEDDGKDGDGGEKKDTEEKKDHLIPKHRLDYKNRKLKEAQTRVQELEKLLEQSKDNREGDKTEKEKDIEEEIAELQKQYAEALKDDDVDKQRDINNQIQTKLVQQIKQVQEISKIDPTDIRKQVIDSLSMNEMIDAVEARFSVLNEDSEDFDADLSEEILDLFDTLDSSGKYDNSAMALARAVELTMGEPIEQTSSDSGKESKETRSTKTDIDKNLETASKQPPSATKTTNSDAGGLKDDVEASKLSEEEFDALPESTKKRLRGDFV